MYIEQGFCALINPPSSILNVKEDFSKIMFLFTGIGDWDELLLFGPT
jgi:hypothetical protein